MKKNIGHYWTRPQVESGITTTVAFVINRDEEGNATGGVRAPHMPSIDAHGNVAGAPLGSYNGVDNTDPATAHSIAPRFGPCWRHRRCNRFRSDLTALTLEST